MVTLYGIRNCDTVRKARRWLDNNGIEYHFHDVRSDGLSKSVLNQWIRELGWEQLLNRRGTTWRKLPENTRETINKTVALGIMLEHPAIIKRPVLDIEKCFHLGFSEDHYQDLFGL